MSPIIRHTAPPAPRCGFVILCHSDHANWLVEFLRARGVLVDSSHYASGLLAGTYQSTAPEGARSELQGHLREAFDRSKVGTQSTVIETIDDLYWVDRDAYWKKYEKEEPC